MEHLKTGEVISKRRKELGLTQNQLAKSLNISFQAVSKWENSTAYPPERPVRDRFIGEMQRHTKPGGYNVIGIFTDRLPATPDNAPFTHSLFAVGELPDKYRSWELVHHQEGTFRDTHPGGIRHEHAYERIIARRGISL